VVAAAARSAALVASAVVALAAAQQVPLAQRTPEAVAAAQPLREPLAARGSFSSASRTKEPEMAHFAQVNDQNLVQRVIVVSNDNAPDPYPESEPLGQAFIADVLGLPGVWLQTSYNDNFRGRYAGHGYSYDPAIDEFVPPPEPEPAP
jgi:hypothetical protein